MLLVLQSAHSSPLLNSCIRLIGVVVLLLNRSLPQYFIILDVTLNQVG